MPILGPRLYRFACYYVLRFSEPFADFGTWADGTVSEGRAERCRPECRRLCPLRLGCPDGRGAHWLVVHRLRAGCR